ncbi:Binding to curved DNA [Intoshia linei]|uniref:Binding to curved DNA n=1 Tax=Intoshia linei TaxID=1819745 RepID=A0A177BA29_9BILA|nr:Binding to curved DNA [Intoshia linei]
MGKEKPGALTPKAIANRIKSKGLLKLKFYCQACQKQCRDANGFKCHIQSESHQRQLLVVSENTNLYVGEYSRQFLNDFIQILRCRFGTKRVKANRVYQEFIGDRNHIHMNSTQWTSLTGFILWMSKKGYCKIDQTEQGWFIAYIDQSAEAIAKRKMMESKTKVDRTDEELVEIEINRQVERGLLYENTKKDDIDEKNDTKETNDISKIDAIKPISFKFAKSTVKTPVSDIVDRKKNTNTINKVQKINVLQSNDVFKAFTPSIKSSKKSKSSAISAISQIIQSEKYHKDKFSRRSIWIIKKIYVQLKDKPTTSSKLFINRVDGDTAVCIQNGHEMRIHQSDLKTYIPESGKLLLVVNGAHREQLAELISRDGGDYCTIKLKTGEYHGLKFNKISIQDISETVNE